MILSIGIDTIEIERFIHWQHYSLKKLSKIFTPPEIEYCLTTHVKSAERFAARFALKEAFFKAFCSAYTIQNASFISMCKAISVESTQGVPRLIIYNKNFKLFDQTFLETVQIHISLSHCKSNAVALVMLEKRQF